MRETIGMHQMKALIYPVLFFSMQLGAHAGLHWDQSQLEFFPVPTEKQVKAEFHFTNAGAQPVTIDSANSSCGCTTVALAKKTYEPGEKGCMTAIFTIGRRQGVQNKAVLVKIHDEPTPTVLTMVTHIPELAKIEPQFVSWAIGDAPAAKTIDFEVLPGSPIHVSKVTSSDAHIRASLETVEASRRYRIVLTPSATDASAMAVVNVEAELESVGPMQFPVYARIAPAPKPAK